MDTNRFRKRTNYALPPKRPVPVLDELGELRQAPVQPVQPAQAAPTTPKVVVNLQSPLRPLGQGRAAEPPKPVAPIPEPPPPVYQQTVAQPDEGVINLSEPTHAGWLDAIAPETSEFESVEPAPVSDTNTPATVAEFAAESGAEATAAVLNQPQTNISIQISMPSLPKLHWPKIKLPELPYRRIAIWTAAGASTLVVLTGGFYLTRHFIFKTRPLSVAGGSASLAGKLTSPTFVPVAPKNHLELAEGKSQATAFDGKRDSYSYTDTIENVPLTVSEQPIPANFSSAQQAISSIARSMNATSTLKTHGTVAYEAKNSKTSTQTIIFTMDNLLIFMQSNFQHDDGSWENYINSLQQPAS